MTTREKSPDFHLKSSDTSFSQDLLTVSGGSKKKELSCGQTVMDNKKAYPAGCVPSPFLVWGDLNAVDPFGGRPLP